MYVCEHKLIIKLINFYCRKDPLKELKSMGLASRNLCAFRELRSKPINIARAFPFWRMHDNCILQRCTREAWSLFEAIKSTCTLSETALEARVFRKAVPFGPNRPKTSIANGTKYSPMHCSLVHMLRFFCFLRPGKWVWPFVEAFWASSWGAEEIGFITVTSAEYWVDKALDVTVISSLKFELGGPETFGGGEINTSWRTVSPVDYGCQGLS